VFLTYFGHVLWLKFVNTALATIISTEALEGTSGIFFAIISDPEIISYRT